MICKLCLLNSSVLKEVKIFSCMNVFVASCVKCAKHVDAMSADPESDDEAVLTRMQSQSPCTPRVERSLCYELSSTIVCIIPVRLLFSL